MVYRSLNDENIKQIVRVFRSRYTGVRTRAVIVSLVRHAHYCAICTVGCHLRGTHAMFKPFLRSKCNCNLCIWTREIVGIKLILYMGAQEVPTAAAAGVAHREFLSVAALDIMARPPLL